MKSTALRANLKQRNMDLIYHDKEHEDFFLQCIYEYENIDVYHISLFYCLGICRDTRAHINDIFDFTTHCVKPECLRAGWQTSGSQRVVRLAFNLFCNGTPSIVL